jgi:hypothetical protein
MRPAHVLALHSDARHKGPAGPNWLHEILRRQISLQRPLRWKLAAYDGNNLIVGGGRLHDHHP